MKSLRISQTFHLICLLLGLTSMLQADIATDRATAAKLTKDGNYKEALALQIKNFTHSADAQSHQDLQAIISSFTRLRNYEQFDAIIQLAEKKYANDSLVLNQAANAYRSVPRDGVFLDNKYLRGANRYSSRGPRGQYANSYDHDRVRALQLLDKAFHAATTPQQKAIVIGSQLSAIMQDRHGSQSWKLQELTDTSKLPEIERSYRSHSGTRGAPATADGDPLYYEVPASYAAAKNDGERWRYLLHELVKISPAQKRHADLKLAQFLHQQFGVRSLQSFSWYHRYQSNHADSDEENQGIMQVHTLKDNETVARLANSVKRFTLPDSQNYIRIYQNLWENGDTHAGDTLVSIYLDRRQYTRAATLLKSIIETKGDDKHKSRAKRLSQITADWGKFASNKSKFTIGEDKHISLLYRNAKSATLTIFPIDVQAIHDDAWKYISSNPLRLDWQKIQVHNLLRDAINGGKNKYIGDQIAEQNYELTPRDGHWDTLAQLKLPELKKAGAYIVKATLPDGKKCYTIVWIDDLIIASRSIKGGTLYYVSDATTGAPVAGADLHFRGYHSERLKKKRLLRTHTIHTKTFQRKTDANGQVIIENKDQHYQWTIEARKGEQRAWIGYSRIWSHHHDSTYNYSERKAFGITSQPVYKPESTVKGKFWVRDAKYDLGETSNHAGKTFYLQLIDPQGAKVGKQSKVTADAFGGIPFSYEIAADAKLGRYTILLSQSTRHSFASHHFRVEQYKKPEYEVSVEAPTTPVQLGDAFEAKVIAKYYHGAPVTNATVKVKVLRHTHTTRWFPVGRWDWLYGSGYGWLDIERPWYPGWSRWGCRLPYPWWHHRGHQPPELIMDEEFQIGNDGSLNVKIDSAIAKLVHGDQDHRYEIKVEVTDASRRTIFGSGSVLAARQPFKVITWLDRGYAITGEKITANIAARTLDGRVVQGFGTAVLKKISFDAEGKPSETAIKTWQLKPANPTEASKFDPLHFKINSPGQYRLVTTVLDTQNRSIQGAVLFTVRGAKSDEKLTDVRYNDLELIADRRTYKTGEKVKLLINTKRKDSHVMVFIKGAADRQFIKIDGHSHVLEIPVKLADMPNFFIEAMTISDGEIHTATREIIVPPAKRVLNVEVLPDANKYKPQAKGSIKVKVTDELGKPVTGDVALTVYDKSLEYIAGGSNIAEIKPFFWKWRRHFSRTYWRRSLSSHGGSIVKRGDPAMQFLGAFGHSLGASEGILSQGGFGRADSNGLQRRVMKSAAPPAPSSSMKLAEASLDFGDSDDFGAGWGDGNGGGDAPQVAIRKDFADLIKWAGSVKLDQDGTATIPVDFPDNLTTWKIKTWAMAHGTRVGEGSAEVITSKDLIIRLQAPRFFIEKDEVTLSAVVHNYHDQAQDAKVSLELEGGTLEIISNNVTQATKLAAKNGEQRIDWRVKVSGEGQAIVRMKVITVNDSDAMEMTFPVYIHGMLKQMAWSREISSEQDATEIEIDIPAERRPADSRLEVRFSPTIAGSIVDALPYLAEYPYGCTEQTLNRFVPTVITQKLLKDMGIDLEAVRNKRSNLNPQELGDDKERMAQWKRWQRNPVFNQKEVDKMVRQGVARLTEMQLSNGGWGWFSGYGEHAYPHTTAVVVHGLKLAKDNGAKVPDAVLARGLAWLKNYEAKETKKLRNYDKEDPKPHTKARPSSIDAFVRLVLAENGIPNQEMIDFQFRDKNHYGIYAKSLLGMSLHLAKDNKRRDAVIRNIEQFLKYDAENQTAYLEMENGGYWWYWYGSEFEAHAWYLKLLAYSKPKSKQARGIVKYLINNRKHATYWNSTRDTAYCIEAIAAYMNASGESDPNAEVEILFDGKPYKKVRIDKENLFSFDNKLTLAGDILSTGKHKIQIRRKGKGPLYTNAYLTVFTKEDHIKKAGLEVKVERRFYKLVPKHAETTVAGNHGQVVKQKTDEMKRIPLKVGDTLASGDIIEVELLLESKNDYEYLMFSDFKAAGTEAEEVRSGYMSTGSMHAYMEVRDEKVCFFVRQLSRGKHSLRYRLRAEIPGKFSALPATADAMYAPELRANSDEMKLSIEDKKEDK